MHVKLLSECCSVEKGIDVVGLERSVVTEKRWFEGTKIRGRSNNFMNNIAATASHLESLQYGLPLPKKTFRYMDPETKPTALYEPPT